MRIKFFATATLSVALLLGSCSTPKNINYFQDVHSGTVIAPAKQLDIKVKPEDKLSIIVTAQDPALSQLFNLVSTQNRLGGTTSTTSQVGNMGDSGSGQMAYYTVNRMGDIDFPVLGELHVAGMNRYEVADYIKQRLSERDLVKNPIVTVEFANTGISIIGEVAAPGRYEFNKDQMTIVDAIAMAGDLKINAARSNILVMRKNSDGKQEGFRIDLTDMHSLANSPAYYLQQDDVIYVEPNDKLKRETTPNGNTPYTPAFWVSMGSFAMTIATLVITLTK
ncbi:MAG: polysaccharide biosynthesis/export family protein [Muribaculaceae bacterium]|nr:polysaccharide biosynthesis/export family protein [Muribaculaceae bacterium]